MNRLFGTGKPKAPKPTLDDAIASTEARVSAFDVRIKRFEGELAGFRDKMQKMRDGPGKDAIKKRAMAVLRQKKMCEAQRDQLMQQSFNMESAILATENIKNTMTTMQAMQDANKTMKKQYKNVDIDKIYEMQDDMEELLEQANEVQELMGRSYNLPDDIDEHDLEAELDALGDDLNFEEDVPSYLNDAMPAMPELLPEAPQGPTQQTADSRPGDLARAEPALRM
ncbi:Vacuolar protein-sorting-associated protein 60 [Coemansia pectinata]|uniref:Vacuolar protein-sorting-associated protein 60 n=1 Tax=Coemansia pectinata TaxID=1052879 RepID=A0A9W8H1C4_9FUNG|nr:Vacuolar protein-sorting-associated protein 60 [Coemansia pectinata]